MGFKLITPFYYPSFKTIPIFFRLCVFAISFNSSKSSYLETSTLNTKIFISAYLITFTISYADSIEEVSIIIYL